jgi:hypothetical protein
MITSISVAPQQRALAITRPVMDRTLIFVSRLVNILTFGSPREMFCTRAYRNRWKRIVYVIDGYFILRGKHPHHCRMSYVWDVWFNGRPR